MPGSTIASIGQATASLTTVARMRSRPNMPSRSSFSVIVHFDVDVQAARLGIELHADMIDLAREYFVGAGIDANVDRLPFGHGRAVGLEHLAVYPHRR